MGYFLAPSLSRLRDELNAVWPRRDKASDGWIGDLAHQGTPSDHNPNGRGSVNAIDIDKDGINVDTVIAACKKHPSTNYIIFNRRIYLRATGFRSDPYSGDNPHDKHIHVSIMQTLSAENSARPWFADQPAPPTDQPAVKLGSRVLKLTTPPMTGKDVTFVQAWIGMNRAGPADGIYATRTEAGVRWYQQMRGIPVTGQVDRATWDQMGVKM